MRQVLLGVVLLCAAGCQASSNRFQSVMSAEAEALAGARVAPALEERFGGVERDAEAEARMAAIGDLLIENSSELSGQYQFRVLASDEVNAFSLPGGRVYVTRGLYDSLSDDCLLAATLAHEMAHLVHKDSFKPRCSCPEEALCREVAADVAGAAYLERAGICCVAMQELVQLVEDKQPAGWAEVRCRRIAAMNLQQQYLYALASLGYPVVWADGNV